MTSHVIRVFYAGQLYEEWDTTTYWNSRLDIPDGAYIHIPPGLRYVITEPGWYRKGLTPVLDQDVPPTLKALLLLLT